MKPNKTVTRPDLIYVRKRLEHPNTVNGICGVNVVAHEKHHAALKAQFDGLYNGFEAFNGGFQYQTANGLLSVRSTHAFENDIGPLPSEIREEDTPSIAGMDFTTGDLNTLLDYITKSKSDHRAVESGVALTNQSLTANTIMHFFKSR